MTIVQQTIQIDYTESSPTVWYGCYDGGWQGLISEQAFSHPAKFSRNLISRIYAYALEMGYLKPGDTVLDPFGGVGLGALDAGANGLNWVGCELEKRFTDLGQGCDCTGISKTDWVRFYGRWEKANYKNGRHWCPQCLAQAKQVVIDQGQLSFFEPEPSAAYTRNSGIIPETKPHHYTGNLELFKKYAQPGTFAVLLNGDSRCLRSVIGQAVVDGLLSSPPYLDWKLGSTPIENPNAEKYAIRKGQPGNDGFKDYGVTEGQLGTMTPGNLDAILSSPPYINISPEKHSKGVDLKKNYETYRTSGGGQSFEAYCRTQTLHSQGYGSSEGQLSALPAGNLADSLLTSPPFAGNSGGRGEASRNGIDAALFDRHSGGMKRGTGDDPGNLDHLPMKGFEGAVSSPPFPDNGMNDGRPSGGMKEKPRGVGVAGGGGLTHYGQTPGQLGIEQGQTFWQAARIIVSKSYLALKPGAYTFWVCKAFIRNGERIEFPNQWRLLCESCGFEFVEEIRAMLVTDKGIQVDLNGDGKRLKTERKSFFRRLHESRLTIDQDHLRIDWETVVIMRKPNNG